MSQTTRFAAQQEEMAVLVIIVLIILVQHAPRVEVLCSIPTEPMAKMVW
jgi:uncharacterized membrane protein